MAARTRQTELPHAPLELLHPLTLPGAEIPGAEIMGEIGGDDAATLMELLRAVLSWSANPELVPAFDRAALERTEYALLSRGPDALGSPAGLLAGYMAHAETASPREVAWACICISDWASERSARATAVQFAMAAAFAWPRHARYAWLVARLLHVAGKRGEAEAWLRRSWRIAVWTDDWEAQGRAINSLGILNYEKGTLRKAEKLHKRAITVARRHSLPDVEATGHHNMFVVKAEQGEWADAETAAANAFSLYGGKHPKTLELVADVALFWNRIGLHARSLPVLHALLPRLREPNARIRLLAGIIRAAGTGGDPHLIDLHWPELWSLANATPASDVRGSALYEAALGARATGDHQRADHALQAAIEIANECGANQLYANAEQALRQRSGIDTFAAARGRGFESPTAPGEQLAYGFLETLAAAYGEETGISSPPQTLVPAAEEDPAAILRSDRGAVAHRGRTGGSHGVP